MSRIIRDRIKRQLDEAEGFLMLNLPAARLDILERRSDWATMQFEASFSPGEALCVAGRYREALKPLEVAAKLRPPTSASRWRSGLVLQADPSPRPGDRRPRTCRPAQPDDPGCSITISPATGASPATRARRSTRCAVALELEPDLAPSDRRGIGFRPASRQPRLRTPYRRTRTPGLIDGPTDGLTDGLGPESAGGRHG